MDFSDVQDSSGLSKFSPDCSFIAYVVKTTLIISDTQNNQTVALYRLPDSINFIEWGSDSEKILCGVKKKNLIRVYNIAETQFECKITNGVAGMTFARFSPDSNFVLVSSGFSLRITIWGLFGNGDLPVGIIKFPKYEKKGLDFSPNGKYMVCAERIDCKDVIGLYVTDTWELIKKIPCDTKDLINVKFSPNGKMIYAWDSCLEYKLNIYNLSGKLIKTFTACEGSLGIRSVSWSPDSSLIAIGSYDQKIRILCKSKWNEIVVLKHPKTLNEGTVFVEKEYINTDNFNTVNVQDNTRYIVNENFPLKIPNKKLNYKIANPKRGVSILGWSHDGRFFLSKNENMPKVVWVWKTSKLSLNAVLVQINPVTCVHWDPKHPRLAVSTGNERLYLYNLGVNTDGGCSCVTIPSSGYCVNKFKWNKDGSCMVLDDTVKKKQVICYPTWVEDSEDVVDDGIIDDVSMLE